MAELYDASGKALGDPNAPEPIGGRSDADRAAEIEAKRPGANGAAAYDPAAAGAMGGQSGGRSYEHPEIGKADPGHANGGQSIPGYSGPGRLAGTDVGGTGADANAVTHGAHDRKAR